MEGEGRARRTTAGTTRGRTGAKSALQELAELRKSGGKRVDRFELKEEEAVYDVVDDAEYAKLVQKRREEGGAWARGVGAGDRRAMQAIQRSQGPQRRPAARRSRPPVAVCCTPPTPAGGFVIDEDGLGYADVGEEVDWGTAEEEQGGAEGEGSGGKGKGKKGAASAHARPRHGAGWPACTQPMCIAASAASLLTRMQVPPGQPQPWLLALPGRRCGRQAQGGRRAGAGRAGAHAEDVPDGAGQGQASQGAGGRCLG